MKVSCFNSGEVLNYRVNQIRIINVSCLPVISIIAVLQNASLIKPCFVTVFIHLHLVFFMKQMQPHLQYPHIYTYNVYIISCVG